MSGAVGFIGLAAVTDALDLAQAAGIDLAVLGKIVRHTDAITGGPGAIMWRGATGPVAPDDPWHLILAHVAALGEKDLTLAAELGDRSAVDTPLADLALTRLAIGLGLLLIGLLAAGGRFDILDLQPDAALRLGELDEAQLRELVVFVAHYAGWPTAATLNGRVEQLLAKRAKDAGP